MLWVLELRTHSQPTCALTLEVGKQVAQLVEIDTEMLAPLAQGRRLEASRAGFGDDALCECPLFGCQPRPVVRTQHAIAGNDERTATREPLDREFGHTGRDVLGQRAAQGGCRHAGLQRLGGVEAGQAGFDPRLDLGE